LIVGFEGLAARAKTMLVLSLAIGALVWVGISQ